MNRRKRYLTHAEIAELMAAESDDDLIVQNSDSDINDSNYPHVPSIQYISSPDEEGFTNTVPD